MARRWGITLLQRDATLRRQLTKTKLPPVPAAWAGNLRPDRERQARCREERAPFGPACHGTPIQEFLFDALMAAESRRGLRRTG
jgi:hypothetical protein